MRPIVVRVAHAAAINDDHFAELRDWTSRQPGIHFETDKIEARPQERLAEIVTVAEAEPDQAILVISGFSDGELAPYLERLAFSVVETVVEAAPETKGDQEHPSASLLFETRVTMTDDLVGAVRKAAIRLRVSHEAVVRVLTTPEEFEAYFRFRYRIYLDMGYIPRERWNATGWDVDFKDRGAIAIGAFRKSDNELVGCCRLVFSIGEEGPYEDIVLKMVNSTNDPVLMEHIKWPPGKEPFDLLTSFGNKFADFYKELIRRRIKHAEPSRLIVENSVRRRRIGEVLMDSIVSLARKQKVRILFFACVPEQSPFYRRCGFQVFEDIRCDAFYEVNVRAIAMVRQLSDTG